MADPFAGHFPTLSIEAGFTSNALDEPVTWVDITKWVTAGKISRGRAHELSRFDAGTMNLTMDNRDGRFAPFNTSGAYYPNVTPFRPIRARATFAGVTYPLYRGFIEEWKAKWSDATNSDVHVRCVDATKLLNMKKVSSADIYGHSIILRAPLAYYRMDEPAGSAVAVDSTGHGYHMDKRDYNDETPGAPITLTWDFQEPGALTADTNPALNAGHNELAMISRGAYSVAIPGKLTLECWVKTSGSQTGVFIAVHNVTATPAKLILGSSPDGTATFYVSGSSAVTTDVKVADGRWHHVVGTLTDDVNSILTLYVDGVAHGTAVIPSFSSANPWQYHIIGGVQGVSDVQFNFDGAIDEVAIYNDVLTATQVHNNYIDGRFPQQGFQTGDNISFILDKLAWPAGLRALDSGATSVHGFTDALLTQPGLENMRILADTEGGHLFIDTSGVVTFFDRYHTSVAPHRTVQVVLGDGAGEEPYLVDTVDPVYDDTDIWNQVVITPLDLGPQIANDATSQQLYGFRTLSRASMTADAQEALDQATFFSNIYSAPVQRIKAVSFTPMSDPTVLFPQALGLELLSRIELIRRPKDGSASTFDQESLIEGIDHEFTNGQWKTTWRLSPTDALAGTVGIFNVSTFDNAIFGY